MGQADGSFASSAVGQRGRANAGRWDHPPGRDRAEVRARDRARFAMEVKAALRRIDRPDMLLSSPLLRCRWVDGRRRAERVRSLVRQLHRVCEAVRDEDDDLRGWEVLRRTYLHPAVKQLVAADDLGMSFGTYRRALTAVTERVVQRMWMLEAAGWSPWEVHAVRPRDPVPVAFRERVGAALRELVHRGELVDAHLEARIRARRDLFSGSPRDAELHRVVQATYFGDGASMCQQDIARSLGMPYGSYRRYLRQAVRRLGTVLWFELHEPDPPG